MHFTTVLAASSVVASAFAGSYYEEPAPEPTTTSCSKTVVPEYETTSVPYEAPETTEYPVYPTSSPEEPSCHDVVYTSYSTYENAYDYKVYTSTYYSTSTCPYVAPEPTYEPVHPPKNCTTSAGYEVPEYPTTTPYDSPEPTHPVEYPVEEPETYTSTYYTTVCPGKSYCYATTVTSTYCPQTDKTVVPEPTYPPKSYEPEPPKSYEPVPPPTYTAPPSCPYGGCKNETETVPPPPSYTGAASVNAVSFGAAAFAGLVALFVAA